MREEQAIEQLQSTMSAHARATTDLRAAQNELLQCHGRLEVETAAHNAVEQALAAAVRRLEAVASDNRALQRERDYVKVRQHGVTCSADSAERQDCICAGRAGTQP